VLIFRGIQYSIEELFLTKNPILLFSTFLRLFGDLEVLRLGSTMLWSGLICGISVYVTVVFVHFAIFHVFISNLRVLLVGNDNSGDRTKIIIITQTKINISEKDLFGSSSLRGLLYTLLLYNLLSVYF
jgi:hypothetical protein